MLDQDRLAVVSVAYLPAGDIYGNQSDICFDIVVGGVASYGSYVIISINYCSDWLVPSNR